MGDFEILIGEAGDAWVDGSDKLGDGWTDSFDDKGDSKGLKIFEIFNKKIFFWKLMGELFWMRLNSWSSHPTE